ILTDISRRSHLPLLTFDLVEGEECEAGFHAAFAAVVERPRRHSGGHMAYLGLHPDPAAFWFLGLGGACLGLAGCLGGAACLRPRWPLLGPAALAVSAAALALLGLSAGSWLPPLTLAIVWAVWHAIVFPPDGRVAAALACLRQPAWQGAALLAVSTAGGVRARRGGQEDRPATPL